MSINNHTKAKLSVGGVICCILVIVYGLVLALPRYRYDIDVGDEGFLAYGAVRVLEGQVPNRDFVSLQPPLSFYTAAAVFKFFDTSLAALRTLGLLIYMAIILLVYSIARYFSRPVPSAAAAILAATLGMPFFNFTPFAVWHGVLTSLMTILFIIKFSVTHKRRWAFLAGLTTALTLLSRHDQGFYLITAVLIYAFIVKLVGTEKTNSGLRPVGGAGRVLGFWSLGVSALILPLLIYWIVSGALPYMFRQLLVFPITTYAKTSSIQFPAFENSLSVRENFLISLFYLPPLIEGLVIIWLGKQIIRRRFNASQIPIAFILAISALFYCQVLARGDFNHLLITLPPFFILLSFSMESLLKIFKRKWASAGITVIALTAAVSFLLYTKDGFLPYIDKNSKTISLQRGGVRTEANFARFVENITLTIQNHSRPDESILCMPYEPMFYFLSQRRNPTRWNYIWPGDQTNEDHNLLIEQAMADPPAVVVLFGREIMTGYAPTILDYVNKKYKILQDYSHTTIYIPSGR